MLSFKFSIFQSGKTGSSIGSPVGSAFPEVVVTSIGFVMPTESGVGNVAATVVAIVEIAPRSTRASKNKTFTFNFSPPLLFFYAQISLCRWKRKKIYGNSF